MSHPKINFYCIGAQKAGTTTLHDILVTHSDICLPTNKEAPFYQNDSQYKHGITWYLKKYYSHYSGESIVGSVSPEFLYYPNIPGRIKETAGTDIKFLLLLRNPIDRAISHYNMSLGRRIESRAFMQAIIDEDETIAQDFYHKKQFSYSSRGLYFEQLSRYLDFFSKDQFLILKFEDFVNDQLNQTNRICDFLEIKRFDRIEYTKSNESIKYKLKLIPWIESRYPLTSTSVKKLIPDRLRKLISSGYKTENVSKYDLPKENRASLVNLFIKDIEQLENTMNIDLNDWKQ